MSALTPVLVDAATLRSKIHERVSKAVENVFPVDLRGRTLTIEDVRVHKRDFGPEEQKKALLGGATLQEAIKGTVVLREGGPDGKVLDRAENFSIVHVPYLTERHTIIADGNEYQIANQLRRKPGVYTQRAENGDLKTVFNLGRGQNFDLGFNEAKGTFSLQYGGSNIPLYPVLRGLGVSHADIASHLGPGVAKQNEAEHGHQVEKAISNLYEKLEHASAYDPKAPLEHKLDVIRKRYAITTLDPEVTQHTLGHGFTGVTPLALMRAAKKIVDVHTGKADVDDTDSLSFKTFHALDGFLAERIGLIAREWKGKARLALQGKQKVRDGLKPSPFSDSIRKFVTTSALAAVPSGINPMELIDHSVKVTALGEGGIPSDRAIPVDARMMHSTHFGALDPIRTPESNHAGVDIRATVLAHRDDHGNLFTTVHGVKSGKVEFLKAGDLAHKVIAFPHHTLKGQVPAFRNGKVELVDAKDVTHQMLHVSHQYSPATTLLPLIRSMQGNRAIMASKMGTQALPLLEREAPFVQVKSPFSNGESFEAIYGHQIVPRATVSGTIAKIENGFVYIKPSTVKKAEEALKVAEDRPVLRQKTLGPHTFNIEIAKGHLVSGNKYPSPADYGHLPGYVGPDGDSLDFFIGDHPDGVLAVLDKQKNVDGKGWVTTDKKFVVGMRPDEYNTWRTHPAMTAHPQVRYTNGRHFENWDALNDHIDEHFKNEKTAASKDDGLVKVPFQTYFPFPSKTALHHTLDVKVGDKVEEGERLGDSNFTRKGVLALGKNLRVAYMPYYGMNSNDAVVISESCAKKLTSEHVYREVFPITSQVELSKAKHKVFYGPRYTPAQYAKLDDKGIIKPGSTVNPKDPLVIGLVKTQILGNDLLLGQISKALTTPYREVALLWEHGTPGEVLEVHVSSGQVAILVRTHEQMQVGDKLAGRHGNKGVVSKIVPDHEMIQDEQGRPIDLLLTSAGVISRINPSQIHETVLGKIVEKTGVPIAYDNARSEDAHKYVDDLCKLHGVNPLETVYDPVLKRKIKGGDGKGVHVGRQYIYKLFKSTDTNFAGHGVGPYDVNEQPLKTGGDDSAKGLGKMEFDALVAHNARSYLQEAASIKSQKNDDFWRALQTGAPLPAPKPTFAFNKLVAMLEGAGVKVEKRDSKLKLLPMTDRDILKRSSGAIENKKTLIAKNLKPETGGLFDPTTTGGVKGTLYSHIKLHERVPNPVFVEPIRRLLKLSQKEFDQHVHDSGGAYFYDRLKALDVDAKLKEQIERMKKSSGTELDDAVKQIKYLRALKTEGIAPHEAYTLSHVPVIPPVFRPILPQPNNPGELMVSDANKLYAHLLDTNDVLKSTALESDKGKHRQLMYNAVGAVFGTHEAADEKLQKQQVKGFLQNIAGVGTPKGGFFQRKLMRRTQDISGRGTAVPDMNLGMDEVGVPEEMLWKMLDKQIVARLVRQGYPALIARESVDQRKPVAREAMVAESKESPILINRAPTLHRWSIIAAYPKIVQGKTLRISPFIEKGMNLDFDGDTLQVHRPVTAPAIAEAKKMTLSNMVFGDQQRNKLLAFPQHEAIIGFVHASQAKPTGPVKHFKNREDVLAAYRAGTIQLTDAIVVDND